MKTRDGKEVSIGQNELMSATQHERNNPTPPADAVQMHKDRTDAACLDNPTPTVSDWEKEFVEAGADLEHERWAKWQEYMFSKGTISEHGDFILSKHPYVDRWSRQIATKYVDLTDAEKESDRKEVRKYLPLIRTLLKEEQGRVRAYCNQYHIHEHVAQKDEERARTEGERVGKEKEKERIKSTIHAPMMFCPTCATNLSNLLDEHE